ncbi:DFG10 PROTEIN [Salix viminalis]|uniref:DFG10 PROTEIN n=1 Tax=Salix viminalis TaxID=40686 RepID=A0A9Q0QK11_SALVM|nr:DFG10 PROTEIN [Salix viminalis]
MQLGLMELLRAAWIAGTLPILVASLPCSWLGSFHGLVLGFARRGKIMKSSSHHKFTVPQRFFSHFYVVAVVWTTLLLLATWIYANRVATIVSEPFFYFDLGSYFAGSANIFSFHRSQLISSENKFRPLSSDAHFRLSYWSIFLHSNAPDTLLPLNLIGGTLFNPFLNLGWFQWIGAAIFLWGWIHQYRCHAILGSLREHVGKVDEYVIPCGDWFEIVSSPHYLAEIVIYAGVVFASGGDLTIWLLFGFVVSNLIFAAAETHKWYLQKFDNYPSNRVAIIPFVC